MCASRTGTPPLKRNPGYVLWDPGLLDVVTRGSDIYGIGIICDVNVTYWGRRQCGRRNIRAQLSTCCDCEHSLQMDII